MTWQEATSAFAGLRPFGGETGHETFPGTERAARQRTGHGRTDPIVPRESSVMGDAKYRLRARSRRRAQELARRALATGAVWAVLAAAPTLTAQPVEGRAQPGDGPAFTVASLEPTGSERQEMSFRVRPGGNCDVRNHSLVRLISEAYGLEVQQVLGGPDWIDDERFDIVATFEPDSHAATDESRVRRMLQRLLWERFRLRLIAGRLGPVDVLVVTHAERLGAN